MPTTETFIPKSEPPSSPARATPNQGRRGKRKGVAKDAEVKEGGDAPKRLKKKTETRLIPFTPDEKKILEAWRDGEGEPLKSMTEFQRWTYLQCYALTKGEEEIDRVERGLEAQRQERIAGYKATLSQMAHLREMYASAVKSPAVDEQITKVEDLIAKTEELLEEEYRDE